MKDIIFINPPVSFEESYLPVGIMILNEMLKSEFKSSIIDFHNMKVKREIKFPINFIDEARVVIANNPSKIFAFSIMNATFAWAVELIKITRELYPNSYIVTGGPQATYLKEKMLLEVNEVDVSCVFEGELIISELVKNLLENGLSNLKDVSNLCYRATTTANNNSNHIPVKLITENICSTNIKGLIKDLDSIPIIKFDSKVYSSLRRINMDVGRGCAYDCYYCSAGYLWKKRPRFKSAERIIAESEHFKKLFTKAEDCMLIYDHDNFLSDKRFLRKFSSEYHKSNSKFTYGCNGRLDNISDETIKLLHSTNCKYLFIGIETGSPRIQKICKKNLRLTSLLTNIEKNN